MWNQWMTISPRRHLLIYVIYGYVNMIICILPRVLCQKVCYARALHTGSHDGTYGIFFGSTGICKRTGLLENLSCPDLTTPLYKTARCARFSLAPKPQWIQWLRCLGQDVLWLFEMKLTCKLNTLLAGNACSKRTWTWTGGNRVSIWSPYLHFFGHKGIV